jgi:hypothetical protein
VELRSSVGRWATKSQIRKGGEVVERNRECRRQNWKKEKTEKGRNNS